MEVFICIFIFCGNRREMVVIALRHHRKLLEVPPGLVGRRAGAAVSARGVSTGTGCDPGGRAGSRAQETRVFRALGHSGDRYVHSNVRISGGLLKDIEKKNMFNK